MKIGAIIQARMGSSRLPGKILTDVCGRTVLERVVRRVEQIRGLDTVIVAVPYRDTLGWASQAKYQYCNTYVCSKTDENNVLERYYLTAKGNDLDVIMRITADCPLIDPTVCEQVLLTYLMAAKKGLPYDYVSNRMPPTYPDGQDCEVFSFWALQKAYKEATSDYDLEHVTSYLYRRPAPVNVQNVWNDTDQSMHRMTLDTEQDLAYIRTVYTYFGDKPFGFKDVLAVPELAQYIDYNYAKSLG